jgi:hypothetical protein
VRELHLEDSQKFHQLQVADLIASAARAHASGLVMGSSSFLDAVLDAGLYEALAGGVWPTKLVTPADLDTEGPVFGDAAAHISRLAKPKKP